MEEISSSEYAIDPRLSRLRWKLEKRGYVEVKRRGQGLTNVYVLRHTVKHTGEK